MHITSRSRSIFSLNIKEVMDSIEHTACGIHVCMIIFGIYCTFFLAILFCSLCTTQTLNQFIFIFALNNRRQKTEGWTAKFRLITFKYEDVAFAYLYIDLCLSIILILLLAPKCMLDIITAGCYLSGLRITFLWMHAHKYYRCQEHMHHI